MTAKEFRERGYDPRRNGKRRTGEADAQAAYFEILDLNLREFPFLFAIHASMNGAFRSAAVAGQSRAQGQRPGVPDVCIPITRHGYGGAWIENKFGDNRMTPEQIRFRDFLLTQNYAFKTCYTLENALDFTEWYLGIGLLRPK